MRDAEKALDTGLPDKFDKDVYCIKCQSVFDHVYDSYLGEGRSLYEMA
ncbi:MAG: hypothetical protein QF432_00925 [Dehalococcoidales bacterium]|nr:hypothetical protein [Dehalococcoidales bacterium]